ncbi:hypothetical protein PRUPE_2G282500 [Prunus persica]|uniref:Uncharacterized protein n=1 Tax=Prunus persica TaxID=3760 RepID=A0A251QR09_PRUPE|nr:hypothetical protein PRUPE_2G282500 [Prunus persica]
MTWASPKASISMTHYPKALSWIVVSVVGLALFLLFASWVLVTYPIGSTVSWYFYGVDSLQKLDYSSSIGSQTSYDSPLPNNVDNFNKNVKSESNIEVPESSDGAHTKVVDKDFVSDSNSQVPTSSDGSVVVSETKDIKDLAALQANLPGPSVIENVASVESAGPSVPAGSTGSSIDDNMKITDKNLSYESNPQLSSSSDPSDSKSGSMPASSPLPSNARTGGSVDSGCDLYSGSWIYDSSGPLYTNNTCPVLTQMQNCQGNGRPDKEYENWRWKPLQCDLPRFDARKFLELMRGKTIAFIGDSVARNHMESLLCILWQVDVPKNRGNKRMQRFFFKSTSTFVVRIWSSWLVKQTSEAFDFAPEGVAKLHLDAPDDRFMDLIPQFDVIIFSSGHWFAKQSVYVFNNEIVGGQLWWPDKSRPMKINNIDAFGISVETILRAVATHPNYTGIAIVRSYSPDHYEGGAWNTGGSCTGKVRPLAIGEVVENGFTNIMHQKQIMGFNRAIEKGVTNKSKLKLMDITKPFEYRHDGHPGPYRSPDPNKKTQRGPDGRPPPQDCLHWCMPGPVDTWNEFVLEIIRREYEGSNNSST